jgi:hypothetical protein
MSSHGVRLRKNLMKYLSERTTPAVGTCTTAAYNTILLLYYYNDVGRFRGESRLTENRFEKKTYPHANAGTYDYTLIHARTHTHTRTRTHTHTHARTRRHT